MNGLDAAPLLIEVLEDQAPVATLGRRLAAQQRCRSPEEVPIQRLLNPALPHELQEALLVPRPSLSPLSVSVEYVAGRGEHRFVEILCAAELLEEEWEVVASGEPRQLGRVVQPHVEKPLYPGFPQCPEELGRRLFRETDRIDFRTLTSASGNKTGWSPSTSPSVWTLPSPRMCRTAIPRS